MMVLQTRDNKNLYRIKKIIFAIFVSLILVSCEHDLEEIKLINGSIIKCDKQHNVSYENALKIANEKLGFNSDNSVRSLSLCEPKCDFLINKSKTRNSYDLPDTLAYIFNYPDNKGFVIVCGDDRVNPILGYSDSNNFSMDLNVSKEVIIETIPAYMASKIEESRGETYQYEDEKIVDTCYGIGPMGNFGITQYAPFDKYIGQEYPDYAIGCVTVGAGMIISQTKRFMVYHDHLFYPNAIRKALKKQYMENNGTQNVMQKIYGGDYEPTYTYDQAVDEISLLLYWLSKDLEINYYIDSSGHKCGGGDYRKIKGVLDKMGYNLPTGFMSCDLSEMLSYFTNGYTLLMRGITDDYNPQGHVWACDGCQYCYDLTDKTILKDIQLHFDWGWGGISNGYFPGEIIKKYGYQIDVEGYRFTSLVYLPVYIETGEKI